MLRQYKLSFPQIIALLLVAFLGISSLSNYVFVHSIGFNAIELVWVPLLFVYSKYVKTIKAADILKCFFLIFALFLLSLFSLSEEYIGTLPSTIRSYILFFLGFLLLYRNDIGMEKMELLYIVILLSKIGDLIGITLYLDAMLATSDDKVIGMTNIATTPFVLAYAFRRKSLLHIILICALCLAASFLSATRGMILYTVLCILGCFIFNSASMFAKVKNIIVIGIIAAGSISAYFYLENVVKETSLNLHYRLYRKVLERDDVVTGDDDRMEHMTYIIEHLDESFLPHGLATRDVEKIDMTKNRMQWAVRDSSLVEIVYTFGFFSIFLIVYIFRLFIFCYKKRYDDMHYILLISILNIILYLPLGYGLLNFPPTVFAIGCILGLVSRLRKINSPRAAHLPCGKHKISKLKK